jgi:hypothetical protein
MNLEACEADFMGCFSSSMNLGFSLLLENDHSVTVVFPDTFEGHYTDEQSKRRGRFRRRVGERAALE